MNTLCWKRIAFGMDGDKPKAVGLILSFATEKRPIGKILWLIPRITVLPHWIRKPKRKYTYDEAKSLTNVLKK